MNKIKNACFCALLIGVFAWNTLASISQPAFPTKARGFSMPGAGVIKARPANEYFRLISRLRRQQVTVRSSQERVAQPFFSVRARILEINSEALQVFEFPTRSAATREAGRVSKNGLSIGDTKPSWMAPPHFFKSEKLIVLYVGTDETILAALEKTLGKQFAGS